MAKFFIDRPIFAWVIAIFIMLAGVIGIKKLPISQYPSVASPQISLSTTYAGASAQVLEDSVLSVIERNMNGVEGLDYITTSASSNGSGSVTLHFKPDANEDTAQLTVQNKLASITPLLPASVQQTGVMMSKSRSNFLMVVMLTSDTQAVEDMADYADRNIIPELQRLDGVGNVNMFGSARAMRIWVDPKKLESYNLSFSDVSSAISAQNAQLSVGKLGALPAQKGQSITATITAQGQLQTPAEFGEIVLRSTNSGANVYLKDVARIELGSQDYNTSSRLNGKPTLGIGVSLSTTGNALATAKAVKAKMAELEHYFPAGVKWVVPYDTSKFVELSIKSVISTLAEAILLVFIVMFLFLQNIRYTLIPTIVVPISLLGAFAAISYFGMSINVMTMFAMVLVIGIVVDDAIVVVENVERIMSAEGLSPKEATKKAMGQISGAVIGITAVLISVFVPFTMLNGATGNIYRQFSLTMALAIAFSAFLALTLTPALCATMLKPVAKGHHETKSGFFGWFNRVFNKSTNAYAGVVGKVVKHTFVMFIVYLGLAVGGFWAMYKLPSSFLPSEDQGNLMNSVQLPAGATKERTDKTLEAVTKIATSMPEVENIITVSGFSFSGSGQNMALGFTILKDWSERPRPDQSANIMAGKLTGAYMASLKDGFALAINPPPIMELGNSSGVSFVLQDRANAGHQALLQARGALMGKMMQSGLFDPSTIRPNGLEDAPQLKIDINREAAAAQGVSLASIRSTLATSLGSSYINDFPNNGRLQRVVVQADANSRMQADDIMNLSVVNNVGQAVKLSSVASYSWTTGQEQSERFNGYPAMALSASPKPNVSTGQAMAWLQQATTELGGNFSIEWSGQSREEAKGSSERTVLLLLAGLSVVLVLAALYESWSIPLAVVLVVPLGILGVATGAWVRAQSNDIYFMVGMITVMGLSAKNAILIIEFAKELQDAGKTAIEAAFEAAKLRFRPILMTSFAFILGVVPMYIATGASAASQRAIGTAVFWGMFIGTLLSVFLVPMFYVVVRGLFHSRKPPAHLAVERLSIDLHKK